MTSRARLAAIRIALLALAGCAHVEPWQRGTLATPQMALDPHRQRAALLAHARAAREAASGGVSNDGGGCGCD
jgi:hypothetical protein